MDKDEMNKYKWLDAQEVRPPSSPPGDVAAVKAQSQLANKMLNFLMDD